MNTEINNPFTQLSNQLAEINNKLDVIASKDVPQPERKFYHVNQAAEKLGVAAITLYRGVESGKIPHKRIGSRVMIPGSFVDR